MKHTPGPWEAINILGVWIVGRTGGHLLTKIPAGSIDAEANCRLMAAAPEMFEALERIMQETQRDCIDPVEWSEGERMAYAAISKARGESTALPVSLPD